MHLLCIGLLCFIVGDSTWNDWLIDWLVSTCSVWKGRKSTGNQLVECSMSSSQKCQWLIAKYYSFVSGVLSVVREFMQIMFVRELHSSCYWCKSSTLFQKICGLLRFVTKKNIFVDCGMVFSSSVWQLKACYRKGDFAPQKTFDYDSHWNREVKPYRSCLWYCHIYCTLYF